MSHIHVLAGDLEDVDWRYKALVRGGVPHRVLRANTVTDVQLEILSGNNPDSYPTEGTSIYVRIVEIY